MNKTLTLLCIITLSLFSTGCLQASNNQVQKQEIDNVRKNQVTDNEEQVWRQVTVQYYDLEGGFYGLTNKTGDKLLPMNLAKKYQLPGTELKVKGQFIKGMATIQQWGQLFKITDVELIKLGKAGESTKGVKY